MSATVTQRRPCDTKIVVGNVSLYIIKKKCHDYEAMDYVVCVHRGDGFPYAEDISNERLTECNFLFVVCDDMDCQLSTNKVLETAWRVIERPERCLVRWQRKPTLSTRPCPVTRVTWNIIKLRIMLWWLRKRPSRVLKIKGWRHCGN